MDTNNKQNDSKFTYKFSAELDLKENFELFDQGSEARVYKGKFLGKPSILKERFVKAYRCFELDEALAHERIKAEARALNRCLEIGVKCPAVYFTDIDKRYILLQEITGSITVKEHLVSCLQKNDPDSINKRTLLAHKIGKGVAKMHANDLMHGDLTTSNLLLKAKDLANLGEDFEVYFIDFGLSKRGASVEDMAVDLYVLERAISSSHPKSDQFYADILGQYLTTVGNRSNSISAKLEEVRQRGRKRSMIG